MTISDEISRNLEQGFIFCDEKSGEFFKCRADFISKTSAFSRAVKKWREIIKSGRSEFLTETLELEAGGKTVEILKPNFIK